MLNQKIIKKQYFTALEINEEKMDKKIIRALTAPAIVFIFHVIILYNGVYDKIPNIDIIMHFAGGASIALMFSFLLNIAENKELISIPKSLRFLFVVSFVALIATFWEFLEFALDIAINFKSQLSIADTMGDLLMGLLGAIAGYTIAKYIKN